MLTEYLISGFSLTSIALAYFPSRDLRRYACLFGLAAQPFWIALVIHKGLWGILPLTPAYTILYLIAIWNHWRPQCLQPN